MAKSMNLPFDAVATVPVVVTTDFGATLPLPADLAATSDNPAVSVSLATGGISMAATARTGSATITVTGGGLTDTVAVSVTAPVANAMTIEVDAVTFSANPSVPA